MRTAASLVADQAAPRAARDLVRAAATQVGCSPECVEVAVLLASELVTNAVLHGGGDVVTLSMDAPENGVTLTVSVEDRSSDAPRVLEVDSARPHGRGLHLVDRLADAWGVEPRRDGAAGKAVWFRVPRR